MRNLGRYAILTLTLVCVLGSVATPHTANATVTSEQIQSLVTEGKETFNKNNLHPYFAEAYVDMVKSVANRLKNDPEVDSSQLRKYALEGIPGATTREQQGLIPLLNEIINTPEEEGALNWILDNYTGERMSQTEARIALAQANYLVTKSIVEGELAGGVTNASAADTTLSNAYTTAAQNIDTAIKTAPKVCKSLVDTFIICLDVGVTWFVKTFLLEFSGFLLWLAANMLNYAMLHGIFNFNTEFASQSIYPIWLIIRKAVALAMFFLVLAVGFMSVIGRSDDFKKALIFFIVFGLFVNFSYSATRDIADISNVISLKMYESALGPVLFLKTDDPNTAGAKIVSALGLTKLVTSATAVKTDASAGFDQQIASTPGALMAVAYVLYAAYFFFTAAFLIIMRAVLLMCIIVASPILLVDVVFPALGERASKLRKIFFSQLILAPVFTIMLTLTLRFLEIFKDKGVTANGVLTSAAAASSVTIFFNLIVMLAVLHIALKVTKSVAGEIGEFTTKWANRGAQLGGGLALAGGAIGIGMVGRQTIGRGANAFARSETGRNLAKTWGGEKVLQTAENLGKRNYDLRNMSMVQGVAGAAKLKGVGKGTQRSYAQLREERETTIKERAGQMTNIDDRDAFIARKTSGILGVGTQGAEALANSAPGQLLGLDPNQITSLRTRSEIQKADDDIYKRYINASESERKRMAQDEKNKVYSGHFASFDAYMKEKDPTKRKELADSMKLSEDVRGELDKQDKALESGKRRNEDRAVSYMTADQATRETILRASEKDETLKKLINAIERLQNVVPGNTQEKAAILQEMMTKDGANTELVKRLIANDTHTGLTEAEAITQKQELYRTIDPQAPPVTSDQALRELKEATARSSDGSKEDEAARQAALATQKAQTQATETLATAAQALEKAQNQANGTLVNEAFKQSQLAEDQRRLTEQLLGRMDDLTQALVRNADGKRRPARTQYQAQQQTQSTDGGVTAATISV